MLKVSVIVPVYNPGAHIDDCIASLLDQSLPEDEYEAIFVDDGSTDGTAERLDELAAAHGHVRVEHIPNSGWPGRPRNVGMDMARGEYVYFVDNDDYLGHEALERLYARAREDDADIVIGKVVGQGKSVPRVLFRQNRSGLQLGWRSLLGLLTPHKLFRRAMLTEHDIRFPEGRRRLEDHLFVMHAYFHAERGISILADYPCYNWVLRDDRTENASFGQFDPKGYFDNVREVLDLVEEHTEPGEFRDQLLTHWYRGKMLKRVGGKAFLRREDAYRRQLYEEIRGLALERYDDDAFEGRLAYWLKVRSRLLRGGHYEALHDLARFESALKADVLARDVTEDADGVTFTLEARLTGEGGPLRFLRDRGGERGDRLRWAAPEAVRDVLPPELLDATKPVNSSLVRTIAHSRTDRSEFLLEAEHEVRLDDAGDAVTPVIVAQVRLDGRTAAAGGPLGAGDWEVRALVDIAGFNAVGNALEKSRTGRRDPLVLTVDDEGRARRPRKPATPPPTLRRRVARRAPWLARAVRRVRS